MAYMSNVTINGRMNTEKKGVAGFFSAIGRSLVSGESMFITEAVGDADDGKIGIAPAIPGKIMSLDVGERQYCLNTGAFLAYGSCNSPSNNNYHLEISLPEKSFYPFAK